MQVLLEIAAWAGGAVGVATLVGLAVKAFRGVRRVSHFLDDWFGEEARPGIAARPGVMERIGAVEDGFSSLERDVASIKVHVGMEGAA